MKFESIEIEQALIGRMLSTERKNLAWLEYSESDFADPVHWELYTEILDGKTVVEFATEPSYEYVRSLVDAYPLPLIPGDNSYADVLKELGRKRRIYSTLRDCMDNLEDQDSAEILSYLNGQINETAQAPHIKTRAEVRQEIIKNIDLPKKCYPTGIRCLDKAMAGGLYEGFTYGFCAPEKMGKTTLAHTISDFVDCENLYVAMEMGAMQIEQRNLARQIGVNSLKFIDKPDSLRDKSEAAQARDNVYYLDLPGGTAQEILHNVGMAQIKYGIKGFIVDYWQLVQGQQRGESEEKHLRTVAQDMANYARKSGLWCILLAQMNQEGRLFGGNGLRKACDQLYMINECEQPASARWLKLDASRYTLQGEIGNEQNPSLRIEFGTGPYFTDYTEA